MLLVDDEEQIRTLVRRYLEGQNWQVIEASGGPEALLLLNEHPRIDLLITDIDMPDMSGIELATLVRARYPGAKVLYLTGFVERLFEGPGWLKAGETFLEKPFTPRAMRETLERLLGSRR